MNTSTPKNKERRRTLVSSAVVSTPMLERADDEKERSHRRSMVAMQRRLTNITPNSSVSVPHFTEENEMQDHLKICTKLYTNNKITTKNAWELHIIDIIRSIASSNSGDALQVGSTSLDIGTKVYSYRVDDVYDKGLKLASELTRSGENRQNEDENDNVAEELNPQNKRKTRLKRRKKLKGDKATIIVKDKKTFFAPLKRMEAPSFGTKENIEVSATDNLFSYRLRMNHKNHRLMIMSSEKLWQNEPDELCQNGDEVMDIELPKINNYTMCQPFTNFEIGDWNPDDEDKQLGETALLNDVVLDDRGIPVAELDGSIHDIFLDGNDNEDRVSDTDEQEVFQAQMQGGIAPILDAIPEDDRIETDYGFNSYMRTMSGQVVYKLWAGPSHWKVKFIKPATARYSGSTEQGVNKYSRKAKVPVPLDFSKAPISFNSVERFVNKRALGMTTVEKITLPVPSSFLLNFERDINCFLTKPDVQKPRNSLCIYQNANHEVPVYNYENPDDLQYCSQHSADDDGPDAEPDNRTYEEEGPAPAQNLLGDHLVEAPPMVSASHLTYALHSKKMDMKKLKRAVWSCLTKNVTDNEKKVKEVAVQPIKFSSLYKELPSLLSADMKKELTCHLTLVALLHLCNENNLILQEEGSDFLIQKAIEGDL